MDFADLNHITLPASVVAELYSSSLIEEDNVPVVTETAPSTVEVKQPAAEWKSLGHNQKNILIVVQYPEAVHLPDPELDFLTTMLGACKLNIGDIAIVNLHHYPTISYKELISFYKSKIVFLFNIEPAEFGLPLSFPHFQLQAFAGSTFLFSPSLEELENDKVLKSKLWVCLKRVFNL